jgi:hypothetical protein
MSVGFIYAFCLSKLIYTVVFGCIVVSHGMSNDMRGGGAFYWIRRFLFRAADLSASASPAHAL